MAESLEEMQSATEVLLMMSEFEIKCGKVLSIISGVTATVFVFLQK